METFGRNMACILRIVIFPGTNCIILRLIDELKNITCKVYSFIVLFDWQIVPSNEILRHLTCMFLHWKQRGGELPNWIPNWMKKVPNTKNLYLNLYLEKCKHLKKFLHHLLQSFSSYSNLTYTKPPSIPLYIYYASLVETILFLLSL